MVVTAKAALSLPAPDQLYLVCESWLQQIISPRHLIDCLQEIVLRTLQISPGLLAHSPTAFPGAGRLMSPWCVPVHAFNRPGAAGFKSTHPWWTFSYPDLHHAATTRIKRSSTGHIDPAIWSVRTIRAAPSTGDPSFTRPDREYGRKTKTLETIRDH